MKKWKLGLNFTVLNQVVLNWYKMTLLNLCQLFYKKDNSPYTVLCAITKLENHIIIKPLLHICHLLIDTKQNPRNRAQRKWQNPLVRPHEVGPHWCYEVRPMKRLLEESTQVWPLCILLTLCSPGITTVLLRIVIGTYMPGSLGTHLLIC